MTVMMQPQDALALLHDLRSRTGEMDTKGLSDEVITRFCDFDPKLIQAINEATVRFEEIVSEFGEDMLQRDEASIVEDLQSDFVNFYAPATVNPYIALSGRGPSLCLGIPQQHPAGALWGRSTAFSHPPYCQPSACSEAPLVFA